MYAGGGGPTDEELAALGMTRADIVNPDEEVWVYEENWPALELFAVLGTQWRTGMAGATGLDYSVLPAVMELVGVEDRKARFDEIRVMERAALEAMASRRKK